MVPEHAYLSVVADNPAFQRNLHCLVANWNDDSFAVLCDTLMKCLKLECVYMGTHGLVIYVHGSRRKRPASIRVHLLGGSVFENTKSIQTGRVTIEVIEAGKYEVAGKGEGTQDRREAESTALFH